MNIRLSPSAPENLVSRDGFGSLVPRQPAHPHSQAESGAYLLQDPSRVPRWRLFMYLNINLNASVQMTSSRVRLGQSFKTVGYGSASCWGDLGAGSVEADVFYIPFIVSVQYIGY